MLEQKHYVFKPAEQEATLAPEQGAAIKLKTLRELTLALLHEVESMKDQGLLEERSSVNFADEVRHFETDLIRWALLRTGGLQRRAARLLNLKVTTLNAKIKRYGIRPHALHSGKVVDLYPESQPVG